MTHTPTDALRLVPTRDDGLRVGRAILEAHSQWEKEHGVTGAQNPWQEQHIILLGQAAILAAPASPLPGGGSNHLGNLLARIHRDGGHRQEEVGTDQACDEAELIVARLLQNDHQWRRIDTFAGSGQGDPVIVAVPTKEGGWIVGEAWKSVMEPDDPYRGNDGWWWAGTELGDAYNDPIRFMNHGDAEWWMPLPAAPTGDA